MGAVWGAVSRAASIMDDRPQALIVAGPTCSGKSALALDLARAVGGVVINADSMQVYRELRIVTARPDVAEEAMAPHRLYGVRPAGEAGSAAWWREAALAEMAAARAAGLVPILCGGSGMYFAALTDGIAAIPPIPEAARAEARWLLAERGPVGLHDALAKVDQATAARLRPQDSQRVARAWEVWRATGRGLVAWQNEAGQNEAGKNGVDGAAPWRFSAVLIDPPREDLRAAIAVRFAAMVAQGAVAEVAGLLALGLAPDLPAMRALGVAQLAAYLAGTMTLEAACRRAEIVTGQYTKRQTTWFRHRALAPHGRVHTIHARVAGLAQLSESESGKIFRLIQKPG